MTYLCFGSFSVVTTSLSKLHWCVVKKWSTWSLDCVEYHFTPTFWPLRGARGDFLRVDLPQIVFFGDALFDRCFHWHLLLRTVSDCCFRLNSTKDFRTCCLAQIRVGSAIICLCYRRGFNPFYIALRLFFTIIYTAKTHLRNSHAYLRSKIHHFLGMNKF